jgi:hypothetical protein
MTDKILTCKDCRKQFIFSLNEQVFYKEKGFQNEPQRCSSCRDARKLQRRIPTPDFRSRYDSRFNYGLK